jgi:hypothetical protein
VLALNQWAGKKESAGEIQLLELEFQGRGWESQHSLNLETSSLLSHPPQIQNRPSISPWSFTKILLADGARGNPGIVMMSPQIATKNSAPADKRSSRIGTT